MNTQSTSARLVLKKERLINLSAGHGKVSKQQKSGLPCIFTVTR
ncbi:hypothetical protein [Spirosoma daeguense]